MGAKIDRDWISTEPGDTTRVGFEFFDGVKDVATAIRFRLRDDDGNIYYGGLIDRADVFPDKAQNADEDNLYELQKWGEYDAGAVTVEVRAKDCPPEFLQTHIDCRAVTPDKQWIAPYGLPSSVEPYDEDDRAEHTKRDAESHAD